MQKKQSGTDRPTDRPTDRRQTDQVTYRVACTRLKKAVQNQESGILMILIGKEGFFLFQKV